jgi:hypothetical protein
MAWQRLIEAIIFDNDLAERQRPAGAAYAAAQTSASHAFSIDAPPRPMSVLRAVAPVPSSAMILLLTVAFLKITPTALDLSRA